MSAIYDEPRGPVFTAPFSATALTTAASDRDLFCLTAGSSTRVVIREIRLGQYTEFADAQSELFSLLLLTGSTAIGGGATITPQNVLTHTGAPTAGSSVTGVSTTVASTASAAVKLADSWNVAAGWLYKPELHERIVIQPSARFVLKMVGVPADALTLNGTLIFQEIGKGLPS